MKKIILTFTLLLCATFSFAQELKVKSFTHDEMNLEARLDGGRTDLNGKQCALVKVLVRDNITKCKGGNVGNVIADGIVKKVFVSPSARFLEFEFQYNFPLKVTFADYGYSRLTEGSTYTITLVDAYLLSQQPVQLQNIPQNSTSNAQNSINHQIQPLHSTVSASLIPITVNDVTFNMIRVDGGSFTMGATKEMKKPNKDEKATHQVTLSTYYIGETEVTQGLWKAVMGNNPSFKTDDGKLPVEQVSWFDCKAFINKLNELTNRKFRLPTEAEWEFAARGGNKSRHTQYSGSSYIDEVAWFNGNNGSEPHPVASKKANELGIYDMTGNVWEWCQDWYGSYTTVPKTNPVGAAVGRYRVLRGCSFLDNANNCRLSARNFDVPDIRCRNLGLRLVLSE